jgi:hypothetical protein
MVSERGIIIAAYGWQQESWQETFYPDDLPDDWQLSYYSNEFSAVVIPQSLASAADASSYEAWADDVNPGFQFMVELPAAGDIQAVLQNSRLLKDALAGWLVPAGHPQLEDICALQPALPVYLLNQQPDTVLPEQLPDANTRIARGIDEPGQLLDMQPPVNLVMVQQPVNDPRALRQIIDYARILGGSLQDSWLVFAGAAPSVEDMRNSHIIAELSAV